VCAWLDRLLAARATASDTRAVRALRKRTLVSIVAAVVTALTNPWLPRLYAQTSNANRANSTASPNARAPSATRIDPRAIALFSHRDRTGLTLGPFARNLPFEREGALPVLVRLRADREQLARAYLATRGVEWRHGERPLWSGAYAARVAAQGLAALDAHPDVEHVEVDLPINAPLPLDEAAVDTGVARARRVLRQRDGTELDGRGVLIGDVDTGVFVFHPMLFRPDAGVHRWTDVDRNGQFDVDVDGVDLDGNGEIDLAAERLHRLAGDTYSRGRSLIGARSTTLRPDRDWLYLDVNGNGRRDYGAGFDETTPAYGEPIFVADDANANGLLDSSERLLRLGTCRVRAVMDDREWERSPTAADPLVGLDLGDDATIPDRLGHATGVAGILVGGAPSVSRYLGLAPGAEIVVGDYLTNRRRDGTTLLMQWALDRGANVLLTEFAPYMVVSLDGSSEAEQLLDAAVTRNVVTVSPAGNLANSFRHRSIVLGPDPLDVVMATDSGFTGSQYIYVSLHHRGGDRPVSITMQLPGDMPATLPDNAPGGLRVGPVLAYVMNRATTRGTRERHLILQRTPSHPLGSYVFAMRTDAAAPLSVDLYVGDDRTRWSGGIRFDANDTARTICNPATSDQTIAVAAYTLHPSAPFAGSSAAQEIARYSSQGPRIDGDDCLDIAAPDNPMSLGAPAGTQVPYGAYQPFGGTSGAGPHVAAAAALLRQVLTTATAADIRARLLDHARNDAIALPTLRTQWGRGRLDVAAALNVADAPDGARPDIVLRAPTQVTVGSDATLSVDVISPGAPGPVRVRWDVDYDGRIDFEWQDSLQRVVHFAREGIVGVRVEVMNGAGDIAAATASIEVVTASPDAGSAGDGASDGADERNDGGMVLRSRGCGCSVGQRDGVPVRGTMLGGVLACALVAARRRQRSAWQSRGRGDSRSRVT